MTATPEPDPDAVKKRVDLTGEIPSLINRPPGCEFHSRCPRAVAKCYERFPTLRMVGPEHELYCFEPE